MSPTTPIYVLTCLFVLIPIAMTLRGTCPSQEDLFPCRCDEGDSYKRINVTCRGLDNERDLKRVARNLRGQEITRFSIENSTFNFIPHDAFKGVKITWLIIGYSTLMALTDTDEAFVGLEGTSRLETWGSVLMNELDWSIFRNMKHLKELEFWENHLETIGKEMSYLTSLRTINLGYNKIASIEDHAFSTMKDITVLKLHNNQIKYLKRSMLPNPALKLSDLILSDNQIEQFPGDMFTNMPILKTLSLSFNKIIALNENTFAPVWGHLRAFWIQGNPLRCDCRMSWILDKRFPEYFEATCASPVELKGKFLKALKPSELWCYR